MVSTDGSRDDEEREEGSPDESVLPPGPRRSTYTPPVNPSAGVPGTPASSGAADTSLHQDDSDAPEPAPVPDTEPAAPPVAPREYPAFVPPPPPAPDFEFLKPETGPVNVVYQLDDIQPDLPFGVPVETLPQVPAGARILPKEQPAPVEEPGVGSPEATVAEPDPVFVPPPAPSPVFVVDPVGEAVAEPVVEPEAETEAAIDADPEPDAEPESPSFVEPSVPFDEPAPDLPDESAPVFAIDEDADLNPVFSDATGFEPSDGEADAPEFEPELASDTVEDVATGDAAEAPVDPEPIALPDYYDEATKEVPVVAAPSPFAAPSSFSEEDQGPELDREPEPDSDEAPAAGSEFSPSIPENDRPADESLPVEQPDVEQPDVEQPDVEQPAAEQQAGETLTDEQPSFDELPSEQPAVQPTYVDPQFVDEAFVEPAYDDDYVEPAYEELEPEGVSEAPAPQSAWGAAFEPASTPTPEPTPGDDAEPAQQTAESVEDADAAPEAPQLTEAEQLAALSQQGAPAGRPWVPERRSLTDQELSSLLSNAMDQPNGTLGVMEELERQLQLRDEETREFQDWQDSMLAVGTPEAIAAVEKVLPEFTDIIPPGTAVAIASAAAAVPTAATPVVPAAPETPTPFTSSIPLVGDAPPPPPMGASSSAAPPPFAPPPVDPPSPESDSDLPETDEATTDDVEPELPADRAPNEFHDSYSDEAQQALLNAPPPLVEPPLPPAAALIFDGDALPSPDPDFDDDTIVPEMPVSDSTDDSASQAPTFDPGPAPEPQATKYPVSTPEPAIYIEPIPVAPDAPALVEPGTFTGSFVDPVYTGPLTGSVSLGTGGLSIPQEDLDTDIDDPIDEIDQVGFEQVFGANPATAPVLVTRVPADEVVLGEPELTRPRIFALEAAGLEPTPEEQRVGRAARMFWLWFAANASITSIAFGGILFSLGLSLRQAIVAVLAGVAVSFLPLGLGTLAGKRSGQPTMVVSRAAFGLSGNVVPAAIAVISRVFWGAALLWILGQGVASVLDGAGLNGPLSRDAIVYIVMGLGFGIALVFAIFGYGLIVLLQLVSSIASAILIGGIIVLTWGYVDVGVALTHPDGSWMLAGTAAVLVFSFIGLLWANSSGDLARYQRPGSSTPGSMLATSFGATIPTFVLISYGALLAASNETIAEGLVSDPFATIGGLLPGWYPAPLIAAITLGLLSAIVISVYSGGFALRTVGVRVTPLLSAVVIGSLVALGSVALLLVGTDYTMLFRDLATTLAVPVAAWAGIFAADAMIRQRPYDTEALLARGGVYPAVRWVNLVALFVIIGVGYGLTTASAAGLAWQGFLFPLIGLPVDGPVAGTDLGVIVALVLGLLVPIVAGIPGIRKQEATARRTG